ncbi:MAG: hypothetical protein L6R48_02755 [Planctomycetes bacterium]|nr:hypothetical protein [Planctomycetota bacterium]
MQPLPTALLLLLAAAPLAAEDITVGNESTISRTGRTLVLFDGRERREYLIPIERVITVKGAREDNPGSSTEIRVAMTASDAKDKQTVFIISQRTIPYATIRDLLLKD